MVRTMTAAARRRSSCVIRASNCPMAVTVLQIPCDFSSSFSPSTKSCARVRPLLVTPTSARRANSSRPGSAVSFSKSFGNERLEKRVLREGDPFSFRIVFHAWAALGDLGPRSARARVVRATLPALRARNELTSSRATMFDLVGAPTRVRASVQKRLHRLVGPSCVCRSGADREKIDSAHKEGPHLAFGL